MLQGTVFKVPAGALGFSVLMFATAAVLAIGALMLRRNLKFFGRGELGGPLIPRLGTAAFLILLWILYISMSILQVFDVIRVNF